MNRPKTSVTAARIVEVLHELAGVRTRVTLKDGRELSVHNIAWGHDKADREYHVTTNISPAPEVPHVVEIFMTDDVASIVDPQTGRVYFERSPPNKSKKRTRGK